jgi:hypothetical protein
MVQEKTQVLAVMAQGRDRVQAQAQARPVSRHLHLRLAQFGMAFRAQDSLGPKSGKRTLGYHSIGYFS